MLPLNSLRSIVSCLQVYQLQQEKKKLQEDFSQLLKEREQLEERCSSYEHEKIQLGPRLEETKWEVSSETGRCSQLLHSSGVFVPSLLFVVLTHDPTVLLNVIKLGLLVFVLTESPLVAKVTYWSLR